MNSGLRAAHQQDDSWNGALQSGKDDVVSATWIRSPLQRSRQNPSTTASCCPRVVRRWLLRGSGIGRGAAPGSCSSISFADDEQCRRRRGRRAGGHVLPALPLERGACSLSGGLQSATLSTRRAESLGPASARRRGTRLALLLDRARRRPTDGVAAGSEGSSLPVYAQGRHRRQTSIALRPPNLFRRGRGCGT